MLPGITSWLPNFLTPRRRPAESRPLRDEPPAFLCAMGVLPCCFQVPRLFGASRRSFVSRSLGGFLLCRSLLGLFAGTEDVGDPNHSVILAVPALAARILAAALLEGNDLRAAGVLHHLAQHGCARDERRPDFGAVVVGDHQNLVERDSGARLSFERGNGNDIIGGDAILLAAGLDHCEHLILVFYRLSAG